MILSMYLSNISASLYALKERKPINARSPRKNSQLKNFDHEKTKWNTSMQVKSSADCQAWNLLLVFSVSWSTPKKI